MAEDLAKVLSEEGWHLKRSAIENVLKHSKKGQPNARDVTNEVVDFDLAEIGEKYIQEKLTSSKDGLLVGPCVLQIGKIRNVSAPKENEGSSVAPRMLKLSLTDGSSTVSAIEIEQVDQISLRTPPGTKVKLIGSIPYTNGLLKLQSSCLKVLGGKVEKLYTKWQVAKDSAGFARSAAAEGGPPIFIAFGQRPRGAPKANVAPGKKSLKETKTGEEENKEFNEQRKAAIAEVAKDSGAGKKFSTDAKPNIGQKSFQHSERHVNTGARKNLEEAKPEPSKAVGMYRELSTESGDNVHEKTVGEFVVMGFKREDVIFCLRKNNNEFDATMDMLVDMSSAKDRYPDTKRGRGRDGRGSRRGNRRGGGRGRGRGADEAEMDENAHASPATLFDFLESKMSSVSISKKPKANETDIFEQYYPYDDDYGGHDSGTKDFNSWNHSDTANNGRQSNHRDGSYERGSHKRHSDRARREYDGIRRGGDHGRREYGSTGRGGDRGRRGYRGTGPDGENMSRGRGGGYGSRGRGDRRGGVHRGRGGGDQRGRGRDYDGRARGGGRAGAKFDGNYFNGDAYGGGKNYNGGNEDSFERTNNGYGHSQGKRYSMEHQKRFTKSDHGDWSHEQTDKPHTKDENVKDYNAESRNRQHQKHDNRKLDYNSGRNNQTERPPRFSKVDRGRQRHFDEKPRSNDDHKWQNNSTNSQPHFTAENNSHIDRNTNVSRQGTFIGDCETPHGIPPFPNFSENPPPTQGPATTFGLPSNTGPARNNPPPGFQTSHSLPQFQHPPPVRVAVTLPNWQKGSHCLAKYWEDSTFYEAIITDIHPTADTAVVQFLHFNNYEEVKLFDLKPLQDQRVFAGERSTGFGGYAQTSQPPGLHLPSALPKNEGHDYSKPHKPPVALYVPPAQRGTK